MDGKIYKAISEIMNDVSAISKDKKNEQQGFKFRGIDDVYNSLHPLMAKHRVFSVPEVIGRESSHEISAKGNKLFYEKLSIKYTFYTEDGSSVSAIVCGVGMDSGDKAANKAMAIDHKYALLQVFCIPTLDMDDPDAVTPPESIAQHKPYVKPTVKTAEAPSSKTLSEDELRASITEMLSKVAFGDTALMATMLEDYTTFAGKDGTVSRNDVNKLSGKWLFLTYQKIKKDLDGMGDSNIKV